MEELKMSHLNLELIEKLRSFQIPGEPDMITEIVGILLSTAPSKMNSLTLQIASGDLVAASKEAHSLKSSALSLGAERLGAICQAIESIAGAGMSATAGKMKADALLLDLRAEWIIVQGELHRLS